MKVAFAIFKMILITSIYLLDRIAVMPLFWIESKSIQNYIKSFTAQQFTYSVIRVVLLLILYFVYG